MNILKKFYCRTYQGVFKLAIPLLPYREPKILENDDDVLGVLTSKNIKNALLVTDKGIRGFGLTVSLEEKLQKSGVKLCVFDETVPNPTTDNGIIPSYAQYGEDIKARINKHLYQ